MTRQSLAIKLRAGSSRAGAFLAGRPDWFIERLAKVPWTGFIFLLFAAMALWTQADYHYAMMHGIQWEPSAAWLGFLGFILGGGGTMWVKKRTTDHEYQRILRGGGNGPTTDPAGAAEGRDVRTTPGANGEPAGPENV